MTKYKIVSSTMPAFNGSEVEFRFEDVVMGKQCEVFGYKFVVTQTGKFVVLSNVDCVITLEEIPPPPPPPKTWDHTIVNPRELRINFEVDLFFKDKIIKISETDRLKEEHGLTYKAFYQFLKNEWKFIQTIHTEKFPLEWYEDKLHLKIMNGWNFDTVHSFSLLREGSFSRWTPDGRCV